MENKSFIKEKLTLIKYHFLKWFLRQPIIALRIISGIISIIALLIIYPHIDRYFDNLEKLDSIGSSIEDSMYQDEEKLKNLDIYGIKEQWCLVKYAYNSENKEISRNYKYENYNNRFDYKAIVKEFNRNDDTEEYGEYIETAKDGQITYNGKIKSRTWFDTVIRPFNLVLNYDKNKLILDIDDNRSKSFFKQESYTIHEKETFNLLAFSNEYLKYSVVDGIIRYKERHLGYNITDKWFYTYPYLEKGIFQPVVVHHLWSAGDRYSGFRNSQDYRSLVIEVENNDNILIYDVKTYQIIPKYGSSDIIYLLDSRQRYSYKKCSDIIDKNF